ncbi:hypothetical protein D5086_008242 [Populus alba]|uniref:Uncharacterized protein n=1 Tax=Populus alba TaxID=43335 RepID=A0ACC4CFI3_POPAL
MKQAKAERQPKSEAEARSRIGRILRMAPSPATPEQQAEDVEGRILVAGGEAEEGSILQGKGGGRYTNKKA